jgi:hypothetical protein
LPSSSIVITTVTTIVIIVIVITAATTIATVIIAGDFDSASERDDIVNAVRAALRREVGCAMAGLIVKFNNYEMKVEGRPQMDRNNF